MDKLAMRGRGLLRRPLYSSCVRWGPLALSSQRLSFSFSCSSRFASDTTQRSSQDRTKLPDTPCRTRFAPSPTGYLHLGSLRTALFNYLLARATGGQFVLRIEDTDQSRLVPDAEQRLYGDLNWAGLKWDEGPDKPGPYGPYRQSERLPLYQKHAEQLVREGKAYRCFCSPEALERHKTAAHESGQPTLYPGTCSHISLERSDERAHRGDEFAIRFKSAVRPFMIRDIIYNRFQKGDPEDDFIIMKRDGFPTYHFANVVDDHHMKITHVIRGAEWLVSTPKHAELYKAFDWEPPQFGHLGLLVDGARQKLSKRKSSANVEFYQQNHILPTALLNFSALLGWRAPQKKGGEVMSLQDMVDNFSLKFTKGDIIVSLAKLPFLQEKHTERLVATQPKTPYETALLQDHFLTPIRTLIREIQKTKDDDLYEKAIGDVVHAELGTQLPRPAILENGHYHPDLAKIVLSQKLPLTRPADRFAAAMWKLRHYIWDVPQGVLELQIMNKMLEPLATPDTAAQLGAAMAHLAAKFEGVAEADWTRERLEQAMKEVMADTAYWAFFETKNAQVNVYKPMRWALLAGEKGLPISNTLEILGREETLKRLAVAKSAAEFVAVEWPLMPKLEHDEPTFDWVYRKIVVEEEPAPPPPDPFAELVARAVYEGRRHVMAGMVQYVRKTDGKLVWKRVSKKKRKEMEKEEKEKEEREKEEKEE